MPDLILKLSSAAIFSVYCNRPSPLLLFLGSSKSLRCVCWQEWRFMQLTCDSMKTLTALASLLLFHLSSLFLLSGWLLLSGGRRFQTASAGATFPSTTGSYYLQGSCEGGTTQRLSKTVPSGTRNRKRDKDPRCWLSLRLSKPYHSHFLIVIW